MFSPKNIFEKMNCPLLFTLYPECPIPPRMPTDHLVQNNCFVFCDCIHHDLPVLQPTNYNMDSLSSFLGSSCLLIFKGDTDGNGPECLLVIDDTMNPLKGDADA